MLRRPSSAVCRPPSVRLLSTPSHTIVLGGLPAQTLISSFTFIFSLLYFHFYIFILYFHFYIFTFIFSLLYFHFYVFTFIFSLLFFHFYIFTFIFSLVHASVRLLSTPSHTIAPGGLPALDAHSNFTFIFSLLHFHFYIFTFIFSLLYFHL
jgi:hypothetical protein